MRDTMMEFALDSRSLAEQAADKIEGLIGAQLAPGDRIPSERELAEKLGIGRSTVRESIKILVSRSVLEIRRGTGTFVKNDVGVVNDPLGFRFVPDKKKLALDLSQVRRMVEPQIAALAAQTASEAEIIRLQKFCDEAEAQILKGEDYAENDIRFHTCLAEMTGNLVIPRIIPIITQGIRTYVDLTSHRRAGKASMTHQAVVDAVKAHDPQAACKAMEDHLRENRETIETLVF